MVLPLVKHGSGGTFSRYNSLPDGWGNPGVLATTPLTTDAAHVMFEDLAQLRCAHVGIRTDPVQQEVWQSARHPKFHSIEHATHTIELANGFDQFWTSTLSGATRTKIRKSEKRGVEVAVADTRVSLPLFYSIYEAWTIERAERRGIPSRVALIAAHKRDPYRKFEVVARIFGPRFLLWVASLDGRPIAANAQLIFGLHSTYWRGYGLRDLAGRSRASYLLQSKMIEEACRQDCRWHHLGESGGVASLEHFKERFGAERLTYLQYYNERLPVMQSKRAFGKLQALGERLAIKARRPR